MAEVEQEMASGAGDRLRPMPTGFSPLDDILTAACTPASC